MGCMIPEINAEKRNNRFIKRYYILLLPLSFLCLSDKAGFLIFLLSSCFLLSCSFFGPVAPVALSWVLSGDRWLIKSSLFLLHLLSSPSFPAAVWGCFFSRLRLARVLYELPDVVLPPSEYPLSSELLVTSKLEVMSKELWKKLKYSTVHYLGSNDIKSLFHMLPRGFSQVKVYTTSPLLSLMLGLVIGWCWCVWWMWGLHVATGPPGWKKLLFAMMVAGGWTFPLLSLLLEFS